MTLQEDDIVLCIVKRIEKTIVFLDVQENSNIVEGTMIFSEVSAGRIRNIRDYIVPNKKIVCKVLRITNGHPELSFRRVTGREREETLDLYKKEKVLEKMLKQVLKSDTQKVLDKIKEKYLASDFLEEAKENPKILEKFVSKTQTKELEKIFASSKETKEKSITKKIKLISISENGLEDIKKILDTKEAEIHYLGSSTFSVQVKAKSYKDANALVEEIMEKMKEKAKKLNAKLEAK